MRSRKQTTPSSRLPRCFQREAVQLPPEVRQRSGTRLIAVISEDAVIIRRADVVLQRHTSRSALGRLRSMFG
ncbi:MAG: hypothetical protein JRN09_09530 [Nitrososphaerota archaeon]|nr:hypothetical protein [Nitrososphaerota archaeon]